MHLEIKIIPIQYNYHINQWVCKELWTNHCLIQPQLTDATEVKPWTRLTRTLLNWCSFVNQVSSFRERPHEFKKCLFSAPKLSGLLRMAPKLELKAQVDEPLTQIIDMVRGFIPDWAFHYFEASKFVARCFRTKWTSSITWSWCFKIAKMTGRVDIQVFQIIIYYIYV